MPTSLAVLAVGNAIATGALIGGAAMTAPLLLRHDQIASICQRKRRQHPLVEHVFLGVITAAVQFLALAMHITLLLYMHAALFASPESHSATQRHEMDTVALAFAGVLVFLDVALTAIDWAQAAQATCDAAFEVAEVRARRAAERRHEAERTDYAFSEVPWAWVYLLALHVTYVAAVPWIGTFETGSASDQSTATLALVTAFVGAVASLVVCRTATLYSAGRWLRAHPRTCDDIRSASTTCADVPAQLIPALVTSGVLRAYAIVDTFVTACVVLVRFDADDITSTRNWSLLYIGLAVGWMSAPALTATAYMCEWSTGAVRGAPEHCADRSVEFGLHVQM
jgi:hypothetical protein